MLLHHTSGTSLYTERDSSFYWPCGDSWSRHSVPPSGIKKHKTNPRTPPATSNTKANGRLEQWRQTQVWEKDGNKEESVYTESVGPNDEGCTGGMQTVADCSAAQKSLLTMSRGTIQKRSPRTF